MTDLPVSYFKVSIREYNRAVGVVVTPDSYSERGGMPGSNTVRNVGYPEVFRVFSQSIQSNALI